MAVFRRLVLIAISVQAFSRGASPTSDCAQSEPSSADVSLLQLNGVLQAIESALELPKPEEESGRLIHTPIGPRVAHASHLPAQVQIEDPYTHLEAAATRDDGHDAPPAADPHADPHADPRTEPHAVPVAPNAPSAPQPPDAPHSDVPAPQQESPTTPPPTFDEHRVKEGYENAHPAELTKEKYAYLNGLAAFAIGPGMFFLAALVIATFGLFVYAYKNDPRVF